MNNISEPTYFEKGFAEDHRGSLEFYNDLKLDNFKRFYIVNNPKKGTVRAWHGHKIEAKLVKVLKGEFVVCTIKIDNWESPNKGIALSKDVIFSKPAPVKNAILKVKFNRLRDLLNRIKKYQAINTKEIAATLGRKLFA